MNTQRENVRRVLQDGENAHPLLFSSSSSSQKSSQSSSTTSSQQSQGLKASSLLNQGGLVKTTGLSQSKKINLSSQLKPLNEGRKILTDKSNKGILLSSASSSESSSKFNNNNIIKQLARQETTITQVFVENKKSLSSTSTTVKIESKQDTLSASQAKAQQAKQKEQENISDEFFNDNKNRYEETEQDFVAIVPVLPIVVPKHLRHLYTKGLSNKRTSLLPLKRSFEEEQVVNDENQDPLLQEKKLKSSNTQQQQQQQQQQRDLFVPNAPALDLHLSEETKSYERQQELKARQAMLQTTDNLKSHQWNDPMMVAEYAGEIFGYLYDSEPHLMADATYALNLQHEVTWKMRSVLIDWVIEIHYLFQLLPETLFLAVNIIDRFLSQRTVVLGKLQLVGITSLFIATKFEEMACPTMQDFLFMTDNAVKEDELIKAERFILQVLDFQLCYPNPMNFLRRICTDELKCDVHTRTLAKYFMEISCIDHQFIGIRPSKIAAAALWLSKKMLAKGKWNHHYSKICGYAPDDLKPTVEAMLDYLSQPVTHDAFFKKWSSTKLSKASIFVRDWINRYYIN